MAAARVERRLAAILAADVVGYSQLMERDEAGTLERLKAHRSELFDPLIAEHRGRVVKLMGDGALCEFASVVDAVACAVAVQRGMVGRELDVPEADRIRFRIGINLGEVIVEGEDIYGDGVNVAARLQEIAKSAGICLSGKVHDEIAGRLDVRDEDMGEIALKNIAKPVRIYRIVEQWASPESEAILPDLPSRPSVVVLPFINMSGDPEQEYFADGLTEDIITDLSRVRALFVIARNSSFTYKGRAVAATQLSRDLGVRYILEGSVRKTARRVRITAQLIDAITGHHVWAEKFDRELGEIFDLQDEITRNVVASTQTQILLAEGDSSYGYRHTDLSVWGLVARAMARIHELTPESLAYARQLAEQAVNIDARCGSAWRCLSIVLYHQAHMLIATDYEETLLQALETAERSARLDSNDEYAHWNLGNVLVALHRHDRAIAALERAIEINPNYSTAHGSLGTALCYAGRPLEGIYKNEIAIRSDPLNPSIFFDIRASHSGISLQVTTCLR